MDRSRQSRTPWGFAAPGALLVLASASPCPAQQQFRGVCAKVKIEIQQELTIERIGFLATLELTNNEGEADITNFSAALTFVDARLGTGEDPVDASGRFFVQPPELRGLTSIGGDGIIPAGKTAVVEWFIIPKIGAGGTDPRGVQYQVGCQLGASLFGKPIDPTILQVIPDRITVRPEPQLEITYFQPRDVTGDDPFTPEVESPIPFTLGVLVRNAGHGLARSVVIHSEQPRIVENEQGLLLIARLLGARVDDEPRDEASLTVNLGDIQPGKCRKGAWDMITSLSGEFLEFSASYTHASELGGEETSVIRSLDAHFIVREVLNDQPGRDDLLDFLADTDRDGDMIPDALYETDCNILPVNYLEDARIEGRPPVATATATADREEWVYMRFDDPGQARLPIARITRSDGKVLNAHNYWTNVRYERGSNRRLSFLNILDFVELGDYVYRIEFGEIPPDNDPPVTEIRFAGPAQEVDGEYFILPDTQIFFTVEDASPVATSYKLDDDADFRPAFPFTIEEGGAHTVTFFSIDDPGNREADQTVTVIVSADFPAIARFRRDRGRFYAATDALSLRPTSVTFQIEGATTTGRLDGEVEIFDGVRGWATVGGVPSSPTARRDATLTVGGVNVDFYRYRIGDGAWSDEIPVATPIELTDLPDGLVEVSVLGRSAHSSYVSDDEAVTVSWVVSPAAPPTVVSGAPETPSRSRSATLQVSGADVYRFSPDGSFFRPPEPVSKPIELARLEEGPHTISVIGKIGDGPWQDQGNATEVRWTVDRSYGFEPEGLERVRYERFEDIGATTFQYEWDGRDDDGNVVPAGWYTVRLTLIDGLGRTTQDVETVRIADLTAGGEVLADAPAGAQQNLHARGRWAVWQDQRNGDWDVFARDLLAGVGDAVAVTSNPLAQERPKTDGRYVVWEDRQPDGNWDVWVKELGAADPAFPVTVTADFDERSPAVDWPWIVYASRAVGDSAAPWQLAVYDMRTGEAAPLDPTTQDQLDPSIYGERVVWQDKRDPGAGEIYLKDLRTGEIERLTGDLEGQFYPDVSGEWVVWSDSRNVQLDLYGKSIYRRGSTRLTDTPENETRPTIYGSWVVYEEDSAGVLLNNLRVLNLSNLAAIQLTNADRQKRNPVIASGRLLWEEERGGRGRIILAPFPNLLPVFQNRNAVGVTDYMAGAFGDASRLLALWNEQAGVTSVTHYTSLVPEPIEETLTWEGGAPAGTDFALTAGDFLWVKFPGNYVLDLGEAVCDAMALAAGVNAVTYFCFPDGYDSYTLIREIGLDRIHAVRMLDAATGRWRVASVLEAAIAGENFPIPRMGVLLIDMRTAGGAWKPGD